MGLGVKRTTVFQHSLLFYSPALSFFYEFALEVLLIVQKILIERQNRFRDPRIPKEKHVFFEAKFGMVKEADFFFFVMKSQLNSHSLQL